VTLPDVVRGKTLHKGKKRQREKKAKLPREENEKANHAFRSAPKPGPSAGGGGQKAGWGKRGGVGWSAFHDDGAEIKLALGLGGNQTLLKKKGKCLEGEDAAGSPHRTGDLQDKMYQKKNQETPELNREKEESHCVKKREDGVLEKKATLLKPAAIRGRGKSLETDRGSISI